MKAFIHARLSEEERAVLADLRSATGRTDSEIVRRGLQLVAQEARQQQSALAVAGGSAGRFKKGPRDLSMNRKHLEGFGE